MYEVNLNEMPKNITVALYGDTRSGKTVFCASWPRPIFFMDPVEKGWVSLQTMNPDWFFDPKVKPVAWAWEKPNDMRDMLNKLQEENKKTPGKYQTLVIDQITWYAEFIYRSMEELQVKNGQKVDTRAIYGNLRTHLLSLIAQIHNLNMNVIWVGLGKLDDDGQGGLSLPGQASKYLPAQCQHYLYQRSYQEKGEVRFQTHTRRYGVYQAGCRDGGRLPAVLPECSYRSFAESLGLSV